MLKPEQLEIAKKKAKQSRCRYLVSAVGFNSKGDVLGACCNRRHLDKEGCSIHAEIALIKRFGRKIRSMVICRVNKSGKLLPINPCKTCQKIIDRMNIDVKTVM